MRHIEVQTITLDELLAPLESVDLIDFDVQGSEFDAISASESLSKARLLHIGTHGREIEAELRRYLAVKGWHCEADYSCHSSASTPVGQVAFQDGVQVWRNLRK
jgi:Methyltransferase FkbM domain